MKVHFSRGSRLGGVALLAIAPVAALSSCCEGHCQTIGLEACFCADGTCQSASTGTCAGPELPSLDSLCQAHGGKLPDAGDIGLCPGDGGGSGFASVDGGLQGPHAFPVVGSWMAPSHPWADCGATSDVLADGGVAAVGLLLFSNEFTETACGGDAGAAAGLALEIALGTPQFVDASRELDAGPLTQVLSPGVYELENNGLSAQGLCTIGPPYDAVMTEFEVMPGGPAVPLYNGVGTVTILRVAGPTLYGSLNAWLVSTDGGSGVDGGALSGSFSASFCP